MNVLKGLGPSGWASLDNWNEMVVPVIITLSTNGTGTGTGTGTRLVTAAYKVVMWLQLVCP